MSQPADKQPPVLFRVLAAVRDLDLEPSDRLLLVYLAYRQGRNGEAWPGVRTIAGDLGLSTRTVQDSIRRLCRAGLITITSGKGGRANRYVVQLGSCSSPHHKQEEDLVAVPTTSMWQSPPQDVAVSTTEDINNHSGNHSRTSRTRTEAHGDSSTKAKRTKRKPRQPFVPPTVAEVREYATSRGHPEFDAEHFVEHYELADWRDKGGKSITIWKQTLLGWLRRDKSRTTQTKPPGEANYGYGPDGPSFDALGTHPATKEDIQKLVEAGVYPASVLEGWNDE